MSSSKSSASAASASIPPRQPAEEPASNLPLFSPLPGSIPQSLPLWTSKYDGICQADPESPIPGASYQPCRPDAVIRAEPSNKKDPPRDLTSPLLPNPTPIFNVLSQIIGLAASIPATCYLWELIRREPDLNFSVKVFVQGEWRRLTITGSMLVDSEGNSIWPCSSNPNELWPGLLAKAVSLIHYVPAITLLTGLALVDYNDFSTISSGFFSKPVAECSPSRRLFNLSGLKPSVYNHAYTDFTKPFRAKTEILLSVGSQAPQLVLLSLDPARSADRQSRVEADLRRCESWTDTTDVVKIITDGLYHQLIVLSPGLYKISSLSFCGVAIASRSESELVTLDPEGHGWTRDPFHLHVYNLTGKHVGAPGPRLFTIFCQIALSIESAASLLPVIAFDDDRLEFKAELASEAGECVRIRSGSVIEQISPGSYVLRAFARSGSDHGICPGTFSVRLLSDRVISCNLISSSTIARNFSDVFRAPSRDLRVFREILSSTCKEAITVFIDVHVDPSDVKFICKIDNGAVLLGVGHLAAPLVKIAPGQKVTIDCRLDRDQSWTSWRMRICPGDHVQIVPSTDRRDALEALKKQWGESDPGRHERGVQARQAFLNRNPENDPQLANSSDPISEQTNNVDEVTAAAAALRLQYITALTNAISNTKLFTEQQFQKFKGNLEAQISQRDRYRLKIQQYEALLSAVSEAAKSGDTNLILSKIESAKAVPSWKVGRCIYQAYTDCFRIHSDAIKQALEEQDQSAIFNAVKAAEILDSLPILEAPIYTESIEIRTKGVSIAAGAAIQPLKDAMAGNESRDPDSIRELMADDQLNALKQLKFVPDEFRQSMQQAQDWLESQSQPPA